MVFGTHSGALQRKDAFLVVLQLRDAPGRKYWEDGRQVPVHDLRAGQITLIDLKRDPVVLLDRPLHCLIFYLPRAALNVIADNANAPRIGDLSYKPGVGIDDVVISNLGSLLLPTPLSSDRVYLLFVPTTSSLRSGVRVALTHWRQRGPNRGGCAVGSHPGRSDAQKKFFALTLRVFRSRRWRASAACRWLISRARSARRWEWRRITG